MLIILLLNSCRFNNQYLDRENDKVDAEKISNLFYNDVKNDTINKTTFKIFSSKFWKTTNEVDFPITLKNIQEKLGKIKEIKLDHWNTKVIEGSNPYSLYVLYYLNTYDKFTAKETLTLEKENGEIKIVGYDIRSDGFLTK